MASFVSEEKMNKKAKKQLAASRRGSWGNINPVTRRSANPKAYNRSAEKQKFHRSDD